MLPNECVKFVDNLSERAAKRPRLDSDDDDEEIAWRHLKLFEELEDPGFVFTNGWVQSESLLAGSESNNLSTSLEMLLPSFVNFAAKKFALAAEEFVQICRHPKARCTLSPHSRQHFNFFGGDGIYRF